MLTVEAARITQGGFELRADLTVRPDRVTAVIGPSGAGKSTLLSAIAGFVPLSAGRLMIEEVDHTQSKPADRPVSIVFQDGNLFPHLTVLQNVALGLRPSLRLPDPEIEAAQGNPMGRACWAGRSQACGPVRWPAKPGCLGPGAFARHAICLAGRTIRGTWPGA